MENTKKQDINYDDIYLSRATGQFILKPELTVRGAPFLSRKIAEDDKHVVMVHTIHYKIGPLVRPYDLMCFGMYNKEEFRSINFPLNNNLRSFKPSYSKGKEHTTFLKTNTGLQIVQQSMHTRLFPEKSYFMFSENTEKPVAEKDVPEAFKNVETIEVVNEIINKSGLLDNKQIIFNLKEEVKSLERDVYYYSKELEEVLRADTIQEQINTASVVPAILFNVFYRKALSGLYNNETIEKHKKEIEFFSEPIIKNKKGDYKLNSKQLKELYMACMYDEKQEIIICLSESYTPDGIEKIKDKYEDALSKFKTLGEATVNFTENYLKNNNLYEAYEEEMSTKTNELR